uniref:Pentacotripeptide-repeat region of PRORP domain-containing protein n=1 Tax=Chlamydomonas leiostraca TaxID=1034604 RepID=A0A7S0RI94_9CHLO|mmetsp:Transcript_22866/g.58285  ORF Transcript_22866/g.58285 Transcript_22866/m.58285 type:complete len:597 (+) Transcript_22866:149-1939(+)
MTSLRAVEQAHALAAGICRRMLGYLHQCEAPLQQRERFNRRPSSFPLQQVVDAVLHDEVLDEATTAFLIKSLSTADPQLALATYEWLHKKQSPLATSQAVVDAALVTAASTNFKPETALSIYARRQEAGLPLTLQAANMALLACSHSGQADKALEILGSVQQAGLVPNEFSVTMVLQAANFKRRGLYQVAAQAVRAMPVSLADAPDVADTLIGVFEAAMSKAASVQDAEAIFEELRSLGLADATRSYNSMLRVCARKGEWKVARSYFDQMAAQDVPADTATFNALIKACLKGGALREALDIYEWMVSGREVHSVLPADTETFNTLIKACHQAGLLEKALEIVTWLMATSASTGVEWDQTTLSELIATVEIAQIWDQKVVSTTWESKKGGPAAMAGLDGSFSKLDPHAAAQAAGNEGMVPLAVFPGHLRPAPHEPLRFQYLDHVQQLDEESLLASVKLGQSSWASALTRSAHGFSPKGPPSLVVPAPPPIFASEPPTQAWSSPKLPKIAPTRSPVVLSRAPSFRNLSVENTHSRYLTLPTTPNNGQSPRLLHTEGSRQTVPSDLASPKRRVPVTVAVPALEPAGSTASIITSSVLAR